MRTSIFIAMLLAMLACSSSKKNDPQPAELFTNTSAEDGTSVPTGWLLNSNGSAVSFIWSNNNASAGTHSLEIACTSAFTNLAYWVQSVTKNIPYGKNLTLKLKIKGNLSAGGVGAAIACLNSSSDTQAQQFSSTAMTQSITGTFDWTTYTVQLAGVHSDITEIRVYLMMFPGAVGQVYFDEIELTAL